MRKFRRIHDQRGALEGLPLYLIILIVVAAIVVAILVGWLSTLKHPAVGNISFNVGGGGAQTLSQAAYPTCNSAVGGDTACFTPQAGGDCQFTGNPHPYELQVTVMDKSGSPLSGVSVTISGVGVSIVASPSASQVTDGNGNAQFSQITGDVPQNDPAGGYISIQVSYSSGGVTTTGSAQVQVEPPSAANC